MKNSALICRRDGSAFVGVLVIILVATIVLGSIFLIFTLQQRLAWQAVHEQKARYQAEAGLHEVLVRLHEEPTWRPKKLEITNVGIPAPIVSASNFGGYIKVQSAATASGESFEISALIGRRPPKAFQRAVTVGNPASGLTLAGSTSITGDLVIGSRGVGYGRVGGAPFSGKLDGNITASQSTALPNFSPRYYDVLIGRSERLIDKPMYNDSTKWIEGDYSISIKDSTLLKNPVTVVTTGSLTLKGPLQFKRGSRFIAGGKLTIINSLKGHNGMFYGRQDIDIVGLKDCSGQFVSRGSISISDTTTLQYPTGIYIESPESTVSVSDNSVVNGVILSLFEDDDRDGGRVSIGPNSRVRGSIYSRTDTVIRGRLDGSVATNAFYFYESPTHYVNWLFDATINVSNRPRPFAVPMGFSPDQPLIIVSRHEMNDA